MKTVKNPFLFQTFQMSFSKIIFLKLVGSASKGNYLADPNKNEFQLVEPAEPIGLIDKSTM